MHTVKKYCFVMRHVYVQSVVIMLFTVALLYSVNTSAALNRKAAVELVTQVRANYEGEAVSVYVNNLQGSEDPGLMVGDSVVYTIRTTNKRHLLLLLVDPKGVVSIVFPDYSISAVPRKYLEFVYPPAGTGTLTQAEPVGIETVVALSSDKAITVKDLGLSPDYDVHTVGDNKKDITLFVDKLNHLFSTASVNGFVYQYFVDSDVQFGTRAVRRELKERIQQIDRLASNDINTVQNSQERASGDDVTAGGTSVIQSDALAVNDIRFENNSDRLTNRGRTQLDVFGGELIGVLENNPSLIITLEGHTDSTGSDDYNLSLSERRATSAKSYLVEQFGLSENKILTRGLGEAKPLVNNLDPESRALNRRVEIRLGREG